MKYEQNDRQILKLLETFLISKLKNGWYNRDLIYKYFRNKDFFKNILIKLNW